MLIADALILFWDRTPVAWPECAASNGLAGSARTLVWESGREFLA